MDCCHLFVVLILTSLACSTSAEMFTALIEMEQTLKTEAEVANLLEEYITLEEQRVEKLKSIAADMAKHSASALANPIRFLGNPVNAFLTVKRFAIDWKRDVIATIADDKSEELLKEIESYSDRFPGEEDYSGAVMALLRLQDTYKLDPKRLSQGTIPGVADQVAMTTSDCFEVGRLAYNEGDQYHTMMWMQETLARLQQEGNQSPVDEATVLDYLSYATYVQGNLHHARNLTLRWLTLDPNHDRARSNLEHYEQMISQQGSKAGYLDTDQVINDRFHTSNDEYRKSTEFQTYEALCRGEDVKEIKDAHKLTCQYRFWHPMFYISPLKEETMSFEPWLAVYHDVLSDFEIEQVKSLATPRLNRATVHNPATGKLEYAKYRISKSGWLKDEFDPIVARISQRCSAITNLTLDTVEELQVVNYGIGGHYEPHFDFSRREEKTSFEIGRGNRILTLIFYMSDVEAGGATAFINAGLKVWPKKGSAAVWYNLFPSGDGDYSTRHAGCPVLAGSKWVANKWFHERGQEFTRPCGLTPDSHDIFVN